VPAMMSPLTVYTGLNASVSSAIPAGPFTYAWTSTCGGTFSAPTSATTSFTAPNTQGVLNCVIQCKVTDACGRTSFFAQPVIVQCNLQASPVVNNPCYPAPPNTGSIALSVANGSGPFNYNWSRTSPAGTGTGSAASSPLTISGLSAGAYSVTVSANGGAGCTTSFTSTVAALPQIVIAATPQAARCFGTATGSIDVTVSGGTPGYTFLWSDGVTTVNRSGLSAGTYGLTVTDSRGCTASSSVTVAPAAQISISPTITSVSCYGESTGAIALALHWI
jgi:hypothetical protein